MAISFGLSTLRAFINGIGSGVTSVAGALTGSAVVGSGSVWIGGKECIVSGSSINIGSTHTGTNYAFAFLPAGNSSTANVDLTGTSPTGTNVAVFSIFSYGTATNAATSFDVSGLTGARTFGRAQKCTLNISYDVAQARGGTLIFANDLKLYNGACEGSLDYAIISGANLAKIYGGKWASGGAGSGTWTLTATEQPLPFMIQTQQVTNGVTGTIRILKCFSNQLAIEMDRENYTIPSLSFQAIGNQEGDLLTYNL